MIHTALFTFLLILLSIYHIMLLAICTTQTKKTVKKKKKKKCHDNIALRGFEPGPSEYVRTKNEHIYRLGHPGKR